MLYSEHLLLLSLFARVFRAIGPLAKSFSPLKIQGAANYAKRGEHQNPTDNQVKRGWA